MSQKNVVAYRQTCLCSDLGKLLGVCLWVSLAESHVTLVEVQDDDEITMSIARALYTPRQLLVERFQVIAKIRNPGSNFKHTKNTLVTVVPATQLASCAVN